MFERMEILYTAASRMLLLGIPITAACAAQTSIINNITGPCQPNPSTCYYLNVDGSSAPQPAATLAAQFTPAEAASAADARVFVGSFPPGSPLFNAVIFSDAGGLPGVPLGMGAMDLSAAAASNTNLGGIVSASFSPPVALQAQTPYWLVLAPANVNTYAGWLIGGSASVPSAYTTSANGSSGWGHAYPATLQFAIDSISAPAGTPVITSVVSGASFQPGLAPGAWVTIFGNNLSPVTDAWGAYIMNGSLPVSLDQVSVSIGGQPAYVAYVSPTQINVVSPDVAAGNASVTVTTPTGSSQLFMTPVQSVAPAFFQWGTYVVATHQDFSPATAAGTLRTPTIPAAPGEIITLWGTGFGATTPQVPAGMTTPSGTLYYAADPLTVTVGGTPAKVYSTVLSPGFAALYQVAIQIPSGLPNGDYPVVAAVSGAQSPTTTLITVSAPQIQSLTLSATSSTSGVSVTATVTLSEPAPPSGAVVSLSTSDAVASVPATVMVPAGTNSAPFTIGIGTVSVNENVAIVASYAGTSVQATLALSPHPNPNCVNISGNWNATVSGSATFSIMAPIENITFTDPVSGSGVISMMQSGCSIQFEPVGIASLTGTDLTPSQLASLMRTGTVSGNKVMASGILALADTVALQAMGVTNIQVSTNVVTATGQVTGNMITFNENGMFSATGDYNYQGQTGMFTLTVSSSAVDTLVVAFGGGSASNRPMSWFRQRLSWQVRVPRGQEGVETWLGTVMEKALILASQ